VAAKRRTAELKMRKAAMPSDADIKKAYKTAKKHCKYLADIKESS
jgi:hypothetical protein